MNAILSTVQYNGCDVAMSTCARKCACANGGQVFCLTDVTLLIMAWYGILCLVNFNFNFIVVQAVVKAKP